MTTQLAAFLFATLLAAEPVVVSSPDGRLKLSVGVEDGKAVYSVSFDEKTVLRPSALGLVLEGAARVDSHFAMGKVTRTSGNGTWRPVYGERAVIPDRFQAADVEFVETIAPKRKLHVLFRAYDEGVAFRYVLPEPGVVGNESTEFRLEKGAYGWETERAQTPYRRVLIEEMKQPSERPFLLELPNGLWAAIAEAGVENFPSMFVAGLRGERHSLGARLQGSARVGVSFASPWRVVLVGSRAGDLLEHNYLLQNLSPASRVAETSWIKPGKVLREVTLSTRGGMEAADFAAAHGIQYIEYDAGWYGHEYEEQSDATHVNIDPRRLRKEPEYQGLDLARVIGYAKSKGIGVWLYVNRRALERQIDELLPLFAQWGVAGVKYGFVNVHTQDWTQWLYGAIEKAGRRRLMLDIHDEFRPTGMSRTYPHLLTQEGIRGNEEMPDAEHSTVLPFTRMLAGAADYTYCWFDQRLKNTWGHQLAMMVVIYSPLQFVYWYDRPIQFTEETAGMEFVARVPTVWDDTRVLDGRPGEYVVVARRKGEAWFVGAITNNAARTLPVRLSMLEEGRSFTATMYSDGNGTREVRKSVLQVKRDEVIELALQARGGAAMEILPAR
ncbi:MAG: glycoside hydrolase family 97 catalytic domain-containing protein [Acidobacteria bacterium]|nr:glycoside hydrolase family 97 catalytic domain-containing protein [Acidobacteriota bacterium]